VTDYNGGSGAPPAGWYPDAANPARERLWTGEHWIEWIRPVKAGRVEADPAGWRADPRRPGSERLWSGEMWTEETRQAGSAAAGSALGDSAGQALEASTGPPVPYAPPALNPLPASTRPVALQYDARPPEALRPLAILVQIVLAAVIFAALAGLVANFFYIRILGDFIRERPPSVSSTERAVDGARTTHLMLRIAEGVSALAFLFWFYRAYRNLIRTGIRDVRYSTGWAVGGWFIPFFNLVRPKQVANDIWRGSASAATVGIARWREVPLPAILNWWWGVWILGWVLLVFGPNVRTDLYTTYSTNALRTDRTGVWFIEVGLAALVIAAVLAILLVRRITRLQDDNFGAVPAWDPGLPSAGNPRPATGAIPAAVSATGPGTATAPAAADTKTCPECAEEVKAAARVCRYCGHPFDDPV
jgi:hypothetical protein